MPHKILRSIAAALCLSAAATTATACDTPARQTVILAQVPQATIIVPAFTTTDQSQALALPVVPLTQLTIIQPQPNRVVISNVKKHRAPAIRTRTIIRQRFR